MDVNQKTMQFVKKKNWKYYQRMQLPEADGQFFCTIFYLYLQTENYNPFEKDYKIKLHVVDLSSSCNLMSSANKGVARGFSAPGEKVIVCCPFDIINLLSNLASVLC